MKFRASLLLSSLLALSAQAEVKLSTAFSDRMVLQRDIPASVFGQADDGEKITVTVHAQSQSTVAKNGEWLIKLKPEEAGGPYELTVSGSNKIVLKDVLFGDVWICGGQSNMAMPLGAHLKNRVAGPKFTAAWDNEKATPGLRLLKISSAKVSSEPWANAEIHSAYEGAWQEGSSDYALKFSAVGFAFGANLHQHLDVPIGLIDCNKGGSSVQEWMSTEALAAVGSPAGRAKRYYSMICPLQKMAIKGAIWYQGESNAGSIDAIFGYEKLFGSCITSWRKEWGQGDFPFLYVQLAGFAKQPTSKPSTRWPYMREIQGKVLSLPHTGMAVIYDRGGNGIHPPYKYDVGYRLFAQARKVAYEENIVAGGPRFSSMKVNGSKAIVRFDNCGSGLTPMEIDLDVKVPGDRLCGFYIAGEDKRFYDAKAEIKGKTVILSSPEVSKPVAVRYAWNSFPEANLYNKEAFPAHPFRTDNWNNPMEVHMPGIYWGRSSDGTTRVLCYGDSITRGTYVDEKYVQDINWVSIMEGKTPENVELINAGRSGRATSDFTGLEAHLRRERHVDHVIIFLGVNDLRVSTEKTLQACVKNTAQTIDRFREAYDKDLPVTILSSPGLSMGNVSKRFYNKGYNEKEQAMLDRLRGEYKKLAESKKVNYIDLWGVVSKDNFSDGLHPNKDGQTQIAEMVWSSLQSTL
jgi:sialate O-acetylesterase